LWHPQFSAVCGVLGGLWALEWAWHSALGGLWEFHVGVENFDGLWALDRFVGVRGFVGVKVGLWAFKWPFVGVREAFVGVRVSLWALKWTWQTSFL